MKTSKEGLRRLIAREGNRLKAYQDSVGVWTIGVGHTAAAGEPHPYPGLTITADESVRLLAKDIVQYEDVINKAVKVPLAQHEFDALVSICFNVGPKFGSSTCVKKLNAGDRKGAAEAIMLWRKPPEIIGRRKTEYKQFLTPYGATAPAPQPTAPAKKGFFQSLVALLLSLFKRK